MKHLKFLLLVMTALLLTSCGSSRRTTSTLDGTNAERARFESVVRNTFEYDALQSKSKYSMGSTSLSGRFCLESGRRLCLLVNAPLLGFEVARVEATQQTVTLVDKYDKVFCLEHPAQLYHLDELSGRELEALECLLLGRIFLPGRGLATVRDFGLLQWQTPLLPNGTRGNTVGTCTGRDYVLRYDIDPSGRLACTTLTTGGRSIQVQYGGYTDVARGHWLPTQLTVTATDAQGKRLQCGLTLTAPELGESTWRDFEPSSSYRQVTSSELFSIVKSMLK